MLSGQVVKMMRQTVEGAGSCGRGSVVRTGSEDDEAGCGWFVWLLIAWNEGVLASGAVVEGH